MEYIIYTCYSNDYKDMISLVDGRYYRLFIEFFIILLSLPYNQMSFDICELFNTASVS